MKPVFLLVVTSALFLLLPPKSVIAKNASIGIYAIIDHATFEPDAGPPNSVRIFGVFVVPVRLSSGNYRSPQRGYLYFRLTPGTEQATRCDWSELKTVAGSGKVSIPQLRGTTLCPLLLCSGEAIQGNQGHGNHQQRNAPYICGGPHGDASYLGGGPRDGLRRRSGVC